MSSDYWRGLGSQSGAGAITAGIAKAKTLLNRGANKGLRLALLNVLRVSNSQVPHEEGDLERDGGISVEGYTRAAIAYGRDAQTRKYAEREHEDMTLKHDAGRNAKFLENAINSTRPQSAEIIAAAIRRKMGT